MHSFRQKHLLSLLEQYAESKAPIDMHVSGYFRAHKALGSKDRAYIAEEVYRLIRWKGLIDYFVGKNPTWQNRINWLEKHTPKDYLTNHEIPEWVRVSFPQELYKTIARSWHEKAFAIALSCNEPAPTYLRANTLKIDRDVLLEQFERQGLSVARAECPTAIYVHKKLNFFVLPEFKAGYFEVQDEASQQVALLCQPKPHDQVLDFCSGSGGKALAFAPSLQGTGQIFLHDVRSHALQEAKKRLKRAGIQNAQTVLSTDSARLKKLKKRMDWVFVDAPCSGTGTLRRNPDMKWKYSDEMLKGLVSEQRVIFEQALSYLKPDGTIIYATCSILQEENSEQLDHFLKTYSLELVGEPFQSIPEPRKKDGFFAVKLRRK